MISRNPKNDVRKLRTLVKAYLKDKNPETLQEVYEYKEVSVSSMKRLNISKKDQHFIKRELQKIKKRNNGNGKGGKEKTNRNGKPFPQKVRRIRESKNGNRGVPMTKKYSSNKFQLGN